MSSGKRRDREICEEETHGHRLSSCLLLGTKPRSSPGLRVRKRQRCSLSFHPVGKVSLPAGWSLEARVAVRRGTVSRLRVGVFYPEFECSGQLSVLDVKSS
jgi:hypothetical protein